MKHACKYCLSKSKVVGISLVVELLMFWPTHLIFHELGWL